VRADRHSDDRRYEGNHGDRTAIVPVREGADGEHGGSRGVAHHVLEYHQLVSPLGKVIRMAASNSDV
jgi:hypothetical protein